MSEGLDRELREALEVLIERARERGQTTELRVAVRELLERPRAAEPRSEGEFGRFGMIGLSEPMMRVYELVEKLARADVPVLVHGETGSGKELVARALHEASERRAKPLVAVNCAAIPAELLESELFGHKRGSFTGAIADRDGQFVEADGGTLFLDEIGDMPLSMQAKLLRVLQEGEVRRVGDDRVRKVDVRVVAASHKDLAAMCREGTFREDLYFRLNVVTVPLPPLRDRGPDVGLLIDRLGSRLAERFGRGFELSSKAREVLLSHHWPGNIRELENELQRALAMTAGPIDAGDLSPAVREGAARASSAGG